MTLLRSLTLRSAEGRVLKPDLVIKSQEGVFVVDVTVRHEDGDYLRQARVSKLRKYEELLPDLQKRLKVTKGEVLPIVVGTRGVIPNDTIFNLKKLNIGDKGRLSTISNMALIASIEIYNIFMDYNLRSREDAPPTVRRTI